MIVKGFKGKEEIELTDSCILLNKEQAEDFLASLISYKEQEIHAPFDDDHESFVDGDIKDDVFIVNCIELVHRKNRNASI